MKIGILGGTFNPIHTGHLILAQNALELLKLDRVLFIPSGVSYLKDSRTIMPAEHRIRMVELAIRDNPAFSLSTIETEREGRYDPLRRGCRLRATCSTRVSLAGRVPQLGG